MTDVDGDDSVLLEEILDTKSVAQDAIDAYDNWVRRGIQEQIDAYPIRYKDITHGECELTFRIHGFDVARYSNNIPLTNEEAVLSGISLLAKSYVQPMIRKDSDREHPFPAETKLREFFSIPVLTGSVLDNTSRLTKASEKMAYGENPHDPGGYFIYEGTVSFIPNVEKLRIDQVQVLPPSAHFDYLHARQTVNVPTGTAIIKVCYLHQWGTFGINVHKMGTPSKSEIELEKSSPYFIKDFNYINIFTMAEIIGRLATGHQSNSDFSQEGSAATYLHRMILALTKDKHHQALVEQTLLPTLEHYQKINTGSVVKNRLMGWLRCGHDLGKEATRTVADFVINHIFPSSTTMLEKLHMLAVTTSRLASNRAGLKGHEYTSMNDWGHKRLDTSSASMSQIFRKVYSSLVEGLYKSRGMGSARSRGGVIKIGEAMDYKTIVGQILYQNITQNLLAPFRDNKKRAPGAIKEFELAEMIDYTNMVDLVSLLSKINVNVNKGVKSREVRAAQESQFFYVCTDHTPDNDKCGLVKHKAISASITSPYDEAPQEYVMLSSFEGQPQGQGYVPMSVPRNISDRLIRGITYDVMVNSGCISAHSDRTNTPVILNSGFVGWCDPLEAYETLTTIRRGSPGMCDARLINGDIVINGIEGRSIPQAVYDVVMKKWYDPNVTDGYRVIVNGQHVFNTSRDITSEVKKWSNLLKTIDQNACITYQKTDYLEVYTSAGRLTRPVYVVGRFPVIGSNEVRDEILVDRYNAHKLNSDDMFKMGFLDRIDPYEETSDNVLVKYSKADFYAHMKDLENMEKNIKSFKYKPTDPEASIEEKERVVGATNASMSHYVKRYENIKDQPVRYVGLHGITKYGASPAISPYPSNNPAARNTYMAKTNTQSLTSQMQPWRHKSGAWSLYPTSALVDTPFISRTYGLTDLPQGIQANAAFLPLSYNQEDACVMSESFSKNFKTITRIIVKVDIDSANNEWNEELVNPLTRSSGTFSVKNARRYRFLTPKGLPMVGARLEPGDVVLSVLKTRKSSVSSAAERETKEVLVPLKELEYGLVVDILCRPTIVSKSGIHTTVTTYSVIIDKVRPFSKGDKFATRHGQKFTAVIWRDVDMPRSINGSVPDVIFNTQSVISRMTISMMIEVIAGKAAAISGKLYKGTPFEASPINDAMKILHDAGFTRTGEEVFYSGVTGRMFTSSVYYGPIYLQELVHKAENKAQVRSLGGKIDIMSRQGAKGRLSGAAVKFGEQERDAAIAHGAGAFALERLRTLADHHVLYVCTGCYESLEGKPSKNCPYCLRTNSVVRIDTTFVYQTLKLLMAGLGVKLYSEVETLVDHYNKLLRDENRNENIDNGTEERDIIDDDIEDDERPDAEFRQVDIDYDEAEHDYDYLDTVINKNDD